MTHKNQRVKESLLTIISRLQAQYGAELRHAVNVTSMCKAVSPLLNDSVGALRQLAVTTLAELYPIYGEDMVVSCVPYISAVAFVLTCLVQLSAESHV